MTVPLKHMAGSAPLNLQYTLNRNICQIHGCKSSSKINTVSIKEWWPQLLSWNKEALIRKKEKNCSLRLNTVKYKGKTFFRNYYFGSQSFFMSCHFTKIFVNLLIIAAASSFNVFKLIGWGPANIYLFRFNSRNTRKRCEICSKFTIKALECRSGVFIVKFKHISHLFLVFFSSLWTDKCLSESSFLCKYYYPKYEDEQMLYLTNSSRPSQ